MIQRQLKLIDLSLIDLIRKRNLDYLSNHELLESELLLNLGLNDEQIDEFPKELHKFCGQGLLFWQYPHQFSKYLIQISKFEIESYLEIGVRHGGTFVITVEYLEKFYPLKYAVGIDINDCPSLNEYKSINPKVDFKMINTQSYEFKAFMEGRNFDLVLIDGSHIENDCKKDFLAVKDKANIIVFHDIVSDVCPGVVKVWNKIRNLCRNEYVFLEYTSQYKSVLDRTGKRFYGIGMAIKKNCLDSNL